MTQHEILILVAAPLLVLGRPLGPFLWAFSPAARRRIGRWTRNRSWSAAWRVVTGSLAVWVLHGLALWIWHLPALYEAAVQSPAIHAFEHVCFLGTACLFWWALIHGRYGRLGYGVAVLFVFATAVHSGALGALMTFAPRAWYPLYAHRSAAAGHDPLQDQQLAGLLMWIPFGIVFLVVALALFAAWLGESGRRAALASKMPLVFLPLLFLLGAAGCAGQETRRVEALTGGKVERGRQALERHGCGSCHVIPGIPGAGALVGPSLERIARRTYIAGHLVNEPRAMISWVRSPQHVRSPTAMPDLGVTEQEGRDIAAYLYTLK